MVCPNISFFSSVRRRVSQFFPLFTVLRIRICIILPDPDAHERSGSLNAALTACAS
jgi:hypothetical protein